MSPQRRRARTLGERAAMRYAELRMPVLPVDDKCRALAPHGYSRGSDVPEVIAAWWRDHPSAWPALRLDEAGGLVAILALGDVGRGLLRELAGVYGRLRTPMFKIGIDDEVYILRREKTPLRHGVLIPYIEVISQGWAPAPPLPGYTWITKPGDVPPQRLSGAWLGALSRGGA